MHCVLSECIKWCKFSEDSTSELHHIIYRQAANSANNSAPNGISEGRCGHREECIKC